MILKLKDLFNHQGNPTAPYLVEDHNDLTVHYYPKTSSSGIQKVKIEIVPSPEANIKVTFYLEYDFWTQQWGYGFTELSAKQISSLSFPKLIEKLTSIISRV